MIGFVACCDSSDNCRYTTNQIVIVSELISNKSVCLHSTKMIILKCYYVICTFYELHSIPKVIMNGLCMITIGIYWYNQIIGK